MYLLEFRLVLFLLLGVRLLSVILSQYEALQAKQNTLEMQISDTFIGLLCKGHIVVDPNNPLLSLAKNSRCLHIQCRVSLDNTICQVYGRHPLKMKKWNYSRV